MSNDVHYMFEQCQWAMGAHVKLYLFFLILTVKYTVEVFTPETFVNSEYKLTFRIEGQNNQKTKDQELIDTTQVMEGYDSYVLQ